MSNGSIIDDELINSLFKNNDNNNYIFIYTPPKVGSTTLVTSLRISLGMSFNVIHIHDEIMLSVLTGVNNVTINDIILYLSSKGKKVYVIDVYRTPVERKMSAFFEKISCHHFNNTPEKLVSYSTQRISDRFNKLYPNIDAIDYYYEKYNLPTNPEFNFEKKCIIVNHNNITYIKLRLCDSNMWGQTLSEILNNDIIIIHDYNTENKPIAELYKRFKKEYQLPINYFEELKQDRFLNSYYSEEEKNKYLNEWATRVTSNISIPYTPVEYSFYIQLSLENQTINDLQIDHYIDNGCYCRYCSLKRRDYFFKAKNGETHFQKIKHTDVINEVNNTKNTKIVTAINQFIVKKRAMLERKKSLCSVFSNM